MHAGGSAIASDTIYREVLRVKQAGKPVIVSMGNVAASGGVLHRRTCIQDCCATDLCHWQHRRGECLSMWLSLLFADRQTAGVLL